MEAEVLVADGAHVEALGVAVELLALHAQRFGHCDNIIPRLLLISPTPTFQQTGRQLPRIPQPRQINLLGDFAGRENKGKESGGASG